MLVPLLVRGMADRATAIKRKTAVITDNMAKLVDDPVDAAVFLPRLLPGALQSCIHAHLEAGYALDDANILALPLHTSCCVGVAERQLGEKRSGRLFTGRTECA